MISFPNAKINLGLYVTSKRDDGFHNIESIFIPVALSDVLEIVPSPDKEITFGIAGLPIGEIAGGNICEKAYQLLNADFNLPGVDTFLIKSIPSGAGLGGGSADGAFMLKMLNELFVLNISTTNLKNYAARLGSDCPFFIDNTPCMVTGRGEKIDAIELNLAGKFIVIVHPRVHVNTAEAYKHMNAREAAFDLRTISSLDIATWKDQITNQFEERVISMHPVIGEIKAALYKNGAVYASMSGSGSAVFGIFNSTPDISGQFHDFFCWSGMML